MQTKLIFRLIPFLLLNLGALAIGGLFTNIGVSSDWYQGLEKAPWTPPGWVFGLAWTFIMVCFSIYLEYLWRRKESKNQFIALFVVQWLLNVGWNPIFFYYHQMLLGLIVITGLSIVVGYYLFKFWTKLKLISLLILPYFLWLLIATSLNAYAYFYN